MKNLLLVATVTLCANSLVRAGDPVLSEFEIVLGTGSEGSQPRLVLGVDLDAIVDGFLLAPAPESVSAKFAWNGEERQVAIGPLGARFDPPGDDSGCPVPASVFVQLRLLDTLEDLSVNTEIGWRLDPPFGEGGGVLEEGPASLPGRPLCPGDTVELFPRPTKVPTIQAFTLWGFAATLALVVAGAAVLRLRRVSVPAD